MIRLRNIKIDQLPANYLPSAGLESAMEVAYMLKRPLLLTGDPGTGKTQFAHWVADDLSKSNYFHPQPLVYNTKTTSTAQDLFYHYDAIGHFRAGHVREAAGQPMEQKAEDFISLKAMGLAIANAMGRQALDLPRAIIERSNVADSPRGSVVLIDEIDKAPRDFTNDLLNELENYEFEIKEINRKLRLQTDEQRQRIVVILTSNFEKNLPDAFLRRCIYYHIDFPTKERLFEIILRRLNVNPTDYFHIENRVHDFFSFYNMPHISKRPSTSEFIDFVRVLQEDNVLDKAFFADNRPCIDEVTRKYIPVLMKNKDDIARLLLH